MSEQLALKLKDEIQTAINNNEEDKIVELLKQLTSVKMTISLLKSTELGIVVNKLKKDQAEKSPQIAKLSSDLLAEWRSVVKTEQSRTPTKPKSSSKRKDALEESAQNLSKKAKLDSTAKTPSKKNPEKSRSNEEIEIPRDEIESEIQKIRRMNREKFGKALETEESLEEGDWTPTDLGREIEEALWQKYDCKDDEPYHSHRRKLYFNIQRNALLGISLLKKEITVPQLLKMDHTELATKDQQEWRKKKEEWLLQASQSFRKEDLAISDMFQCGKCKESKVTYYELQTRSADEPMTIFIKCTVCGNGWKK